MASEITSLYVSPELHSPMFSSEWRGMLNFSISMKSILFYFPNLFEVTHGLRHTSDPLGIYSPDACSCSVKLLYY